MLVIASKVISTFVIMLIGFVVYRAGVLGGDSVKPLTSLIMNVTCPCLIVSSLYSKEMSSNMLGDSITIMLLVLAFYFVSSVLTYLFVRFFKIGQTSDRGVYMAAVAATNSGFMGFPIIKSLYGSDMLYLMVMGNMMLNVYLMWIEPSILTIGSDQKVSAKDLLKALKTPIVIALFIGFAMVFMHIRPTGAVDEIITMVGDITIPLSMILVGIRLGSVNFKAIVSRENVIVSLFSMIVIPLLILAAIHPVGFISSDIKIILVMTAALPTAVVAAIIAEQYSKNSLLLSELVSLTTLFSVITIPATAIILGFLY